MFLYTDGSDGEIKIRQRLEKSIPGISDETDETDLSQFLNYSNFLHVLLASQWFLFQIQ